MHALLISIVVLAATAQASEDDDLSVIPIKEPPPPPKRGLLISENTPVWIAYRPNPDGPVQYTIYRNETFKDAIFRNKRNIGAYTFTERPIKSNDTQNLEEPKETSKSKRSVSEVAEISFLLVMDYKTDWKSGDLLWQYISDKIRYGVAFWNGFDMYLRHVKNPMLHLRLRGVIIGRNKEAMPYLRKSETNSKMSLTKALRETNSYWRNLGKDHPDFPTDSYHFVAVMTDSEPDANYYWSYFARVNTLTFLFSDDLWFRALPPEGSKDMDEIGEVLQAYSEVKLKQYDHLSAGKDIDKTILPGEYYSAWDHCKKNGWDEDVTVCTGNYWNDVPCQDVRCENNYWYSKCTLSGKPPLDGSPCDPVDDDHRKICLEGKCQDRPRGYT